MWPRDLFRSAYSQNLCFIQEMYFIFPLLIPFSAQRIVESKSDYAANPLLGQRNGWMAIVAAIAAIEMVFDG